MAPVCVFIHGGAWGFNGKEDHHLLGRELQAKVPLPSPPSFDIVLLFLFVLFMMCFVLFVL